MEIRKLICEELKLPWHYVCTFGNDRAIVLAHDNWIRTLVQTKALPSEFPRHETLSNEEVGLLLQQFQGSVNKPWKKLELHRIIKMDETSRKLPRQQKVDSRNSDLTYFQLLHYVSETNYVNRWKETLKMNHSKNKRLNPLDKFDLYNNVVKEAIQRLNKCPIIDSQLRSENQSVENRMESSGTDFFGHSNLLLPICVLESTSGFYLIYPYMKYTVSDSLVYSPAIFSNSTVKPMFIIYQILQATRHLHDNGLFLGDINLSDIRVDSNLWIYAEPNILNGIIPGDIQLAKNVKLNEDKHCITAGHADMKCTSGISELKGEYLSCERYFDLPLLEVVSMWTKGEMTNFEYLMTLNYLAGRRMGNPNYHPVLPWIMDFTVANGGWRDLTKSKFRLNKGDRQLELTYESLPSHAGSAGAFGDSVQVPHHVSDVLSEITYYVYKARQTPKSFLCRYVRPNWVPAEYPSSMQRMYEWTPDECIPEFFYDADLFRSIHRDLADLEIPWWATSPEDFVAKHRVALESQHVTERLHHWIDLTFGYKLSGSAAVKAKNVCYHLVDQHTNLTVGGVVQLFTQPHPHHSTHSLYLTRRPTCLQHWRPTKKVTVENSPENVGFQMSITKEIVDDESEMLKLIDKRRSSHKFRSVPSESKSVDHQIIHLPKDYAPLARLNQLESLYTFCLKSTSKVPENQQKANTETINPYHQRHIRDMVVIGCLIAELFLVNKLKSLRPTATLEERYQLVCSVLLTDMFELPRCVKHCVKLLLQLNKIDSLSNLELPKKLPVITEDGLPPPSAHQLLQPLIHIIPFPNYFKNLYQFLSRLKANDFKLETSLHCSTIVESRLKRTENIVKMMHRELAVLLPQLSDDGLGLITPYIKDIFTNSQTAVLAAWYLFGIVSQHLGPRQTFQLLIQRIVRLFDVEYPTEKHMKLFHRNYLLQLIVRLGLHTFLNYFSTVLIEAVGGCKDFAAKNILNFNRAEFMQKNPHLRSAELEQLQWRESKLPPQVTFSPVEENLSRQDASSPFYKSDCEDGVTTTTEDQICTESEIFVFDNDDFNVGSERTEVDIIDENRDGENSSDSTSGDGMSTGEAAIDNQSLGISSRNLIVENEDDLKTVTPNPEVKRPRSSCSFSEGFPVTGRRPQKLLESESYSSSVPNLALVTLRHQRSFSRKIDDAEEMLENENKLTKTSSKFNISDEATESVIWLSHRLGPVLTAKYLSRNLLRMLSLCYLGHEQLEYVNMTHETPVHQNVTNITVSPKEVVGDKSTWKVLLCLGNIASLYGEQFIVLQYFPHMTEIVVQSKKRVTPSFEAGLIGNLVLIHHIVPCLSDATLMDHLQDTLIKDIMYPTVRLIASSRQQFPNGGHARQIIAYKLLDALCIIGLRIGFEMTRKHLTRIIQKFFSAFSKVYFKFDDNFTKQKSSDCKDLSASKKLTRLTSIESMSPPISDNDKTNPELAISEELSLAFCPELAYVGYILFCKLAGDIHVGEHLPNYELIHHLYSKHDHALSSGSAEQKMSSDDSHNLPVIEKDPDRDNKREVTIVGNRIDIKVDDEEDNSYNLSSAVFAVDGIKRYFRFSDHDVTKLQTVNKQMENSSRHLKGNWLAYWEHELGRNEKDQRFNFKQIILQTFGGPTGHQSGVKTIHALDNENSFISASKDKTVKLWSLRSHGDGKATSNCQWTYSNHKKSVFSVTFLDSLRLAASCDSTVHVWDPFLGACLKTFDSNKNSPATVLAAMPAPSPVLITATTEASIRFMDVRALKYMHEFKVSLGPGGVIRSMAISPNSHWIAVGYNTGIISILDVRTGLLSSTWKGHDGEILQVKAYDDHTFITSSLDHQCISAWNADDGKLRCQLRGPNEPVHCLSFYKNELISGTTANRIGVHTSVDAQASFSSTKLQSDTFKGVLTSMTVLPLNRLLLLGADNGCIRLLC